MNHANQRLANTNEAKPIPTQGNPAKHDLPKKFLIWIFLFVFDAIVTILVWKFFMDEFLFNCRSKQLQTGPSHLANVVAWPTLLAA